MRNILAFGAAALLAFAAVGWYLGWYGIIRTTGSDGNPSITIDVDRQRISEDLKAGEQRLRSLIAPKDKGSQVVTPQAATEAPPMPPSPPETPSEPLPPTLSTPATVASPSLSPPPPPPPLPTQIPGRSDAQRGQDITPVEFVLPAPPAPPSVPLPLPK